MQISGTETERIMWDSIIYTKECRYKKHIHVAGFHVQEEQIQLSEKVDRGIQEVSEFYVTVYVQILILFIHEKNK